LPPLRSNNETAIFKAIFNNAIKLLLVEKLLEAGADVNIYSHSHGEGVLHYACRLQRADLTMAFLKAGADVKVRGKEGKTPYELAVMHPELQQMAQIIQSTERAPLIAPSLRLCRLPRFLADTPGCRDGGLAGGEWRWGSEEGVPES
jgi:ankyrin repeat protein